MKTYRFFSENGEELTNNPDYIIKGEFPGGLDALMKYLNKEIVYPEEARLKEQYGTTKIGFVVEKDGSIENVTVKESSKRLLDNEAIRIVKSMPNWIPGKYHNRPIRSYFTLPVRFKLR